MMAAMSLPPPELPTPTPPAPGPQPTAWRRLPVAVQLLVIIAACATVVIGGAALKNRAGATKPAPAPAWSYRTEAGLCDADGYSIVLVNTGDVDMFGKMWAAAMNGSTVVERDEAIIRRLAPGERVTVEFVWTLDSDPGRCTIENFEQY